MGDYAQVPTPPADLSAVASAKVDPVATPSTQPDVPVLDPNRPFSTIPADSLQASPSAQPLPADPVDQVFEATASAEIIPSADPETTASPSADLQPVVPISPQSPESPQVSDVQAPAHLPASETQPTPPDAPKESNIQDQQLLNQPPQVQPEAPKDTPVIPIENTPSQSAEINPKPPEATQNTPPADPKPPESPKTSFGDFSATVQSVPSTPHPMVVTPLQPSALPASPQPIPPVETPPPVSSFGDLMGKPADLSEEPAIHIDPIEAPKETIPASQSSDQQQKEEFSQRRQRANAVRKQKKDDNLAQILEFIQKKGTVNNLDVRDFLHISQTTATDYLHTLVNSGKLKKVGKAKATTYSL